MNNKYAIGTVIGTALLGLAKSSLLGSKNDGVTVDSIDELLRYANDPNLAPLVTEAALYNRRLTTIPPEIWNLTNLKELILEYNELTTLPPEIGNLKKLERLWLNDNLLTTLPKEIGNLKNLEVLILEYNELTTLPPEIGNLKNLEGLYLDHNKLTTLPPEIGNLKNLKWLYLRDNPNLKIPLNFVIDLLNTYQNTDVATILSKYIHQQTIPAPQTIRMK